MGCSLHLQTVGYEGDLFAPNALKIQIDIDPALLQREDVALSGNSAGICTNTCP